MNASSRVIGKRSASAPWWAWLAGVLAVAGAIGIGLYLARTGKPTVTELPGGTATAPAAAPATPIQHPIDKAIGFDDGVPLPALDATDASVLAALATLAGGDLADVLNPEHVIQRIVATIDNLPRPKLAADALPVRGAQGVFATRQAGAQREIDARNAARYTTYAHVAQAIDAKALVAWYVHYYPLFQQAYRELGYPDGYFNDRLVVVIDHLLETPDVAEPLALTQPNVMYAFADPSLEARSAGQKLLLRSGPENETAIKAKLREIRVALTGETLPR